MFESLIKEYESLRNRYQKEIVSKMDKDEYSEYCLVLFSTHSCGIEGNSFSVDDTRELREKGLGVIPVGKTLLESFEILDTSTPIPMSWRTRTSQLTRRCLRRPTGW